MKYENFDKASGLVGQINQLVKNLDKVSELSVEVIISSYSRIYTIGVDTDSEHEYSKLAKKFVADIAADLERRITDLKAELELL